ncbi:unnamed protein product, partial [Symbiodinium necroappetens]
MARTSASRKIGRVLALLALFWVCQQTVQKVRAAVGVRAVPFARPPVGAWVRKPLIARRAKAQAEGQRGEADDKEDDEVSKLAKEHDVVQNYDENEVPCAVLVSFPSEIAKLEEQQYAGSFLLEKCAADLEQKIKLSDGPKEILIERIKKLKAAAAIRDAKKKLDNAGAEDKDRITMVGRGLGAVGKLARCGGVLEQAGNATRNDVNSYGPKQVAAWIAAKLVSAKYALAKLTGMLAEQLLQVTQDELENDYNLEAAKAKFLFKAVQGLSDPSALTFADPVNDSSYPEFKYQHVWVY